MKSIKNAGMLILFGAGGDGETWMSFYYVSKIAFGKLVFLSALPADFFSFDGGISSRCLI